MHKLLNAKHEKKGEDRQLSFLNPDKLEYYHKSSPFYLASPHDLQYKTQYVNSRKAKRPRVTKRGRKYRNKTDMLENNQGNRLNYTLMAAYLTYE